MIAMPSFSREALGFRAGAVGIVAYVRAAARPRSRFPSTTSRHDACGFPGGVPIVSVVAVTPRA
jgi:hypothetical protein